jgi:hypothetical protein
MKKNRFINKLIGQKFPLFSLAICTLFVLTSCEEDLKIFDTPEGFVQIGSPAERNVGEASGETVNTIIQLAKPNPNGQSVNVSVVGSDPSRYAIDPPLSGNATVNIPAGETSFLIRVTPIDNVFNDGDATVTITLTDSNALPLGIAGEGNFRTSAKITIIDDDCAIDTADTYNVRVFAFGEEAPSHTVALVPVEGTDNQFTVVSVWGPEFVAWATGNPGFSGQFPYPATLTINNDFTLNVTGNAGYATGGSGSYASCNDVFEFTISQALFTTAFTVDIVMTGN